MKHSLRNTLVGLAVAAVLTYAYLHTRRHHDRSQQNVASGPPPAVQRSVKEMPASNASNAAPAVTAAARTAHVPQSPVAATNPVSAGTTHKSQSARDWDPKFLSGLTGKGAGSPLRFELTDGDWAEGTINHVERVGDEVVYVGGKLSLPEAGRFFFRRIPATSTVVGVVELSAREIAYRVEASASGPAQLVRRKLGEVLCLRMPTPYAALTNKVANTPPLNPTQFPTNQPIPAYQNGILALQSLPGAKGVIYLDFQGGYTPTSGGVTYAPANLSNPDVFSIWELVAERYLPFNINITTDLKVFENAWQTNRQRTIITPAPPGAGVGGWSYGGCFNWGGIPDQPNWVYLLDVKGCGEAIAHECGHALGLGHHGQEIGTNHVEYYGGQGTGDTGWAPIMGVAYYHPLGQWSKGEYQYANNTNQDDITVIVINNNNVDFRTDDTGSTLATARYLELYPGNTASAQGVVETAGETDAFRFTLTNSGAINLTANPNLIRHWDGDWGSLAVTATLYNGSDAMIASNSPQNLASATIATTLPAGDYTFRITGAGRNDPFLTGFSTYGSIGYYSITGTVTSARMPIRFVIGENAPNGTLVGNVPPLVTNADLRTYSIISGNTGNAFTLADSGALTVADGTQLNDETLGLNTQFPVQFELFVNIVDNTNPALTETNRRVVVAITNVNEAPVISTTSFKVLAHTQAGTVIGSVVASDPDFFSMVSCSIVGGNTNNAFAIDSSGAVSVAGDLDNTVQSVYNLSIAVSDLILPSPLMATNTVTVTVLANNSPFHPGSISYAVYTNIPGQLISDLTSASSYPNDPAWEKQELLFDGENGLGDHYGAVMRGYLIPPASGSYRFWIASDDNSELWLSSSTNPASMTCRASLSGANVISGYRSWSERTSQRSALISLVAGQAYYIEGRLKEHEGGDYISVAWECTSAGITQDVIPGKYLAPYFQSYQPDPVSVTTSLHRDAITGSLVGTLPLLGAGTNIPKTFLLTAGNSDGLFSLNSSNGRCA